MRGFFKNTNTENPVLFYFSKAEELRQFDGFTVSPHHIARPNQKPATLDVWAVVGKVRGEDRRDIIAEFPNELYAEIFRDMAHGYVKATGIVTDLVFSLDAIGFVQEAESVNGADAVDVINEHMPRLRDTE